MSSLKHVSSISSICFSSLAALFALSREGWCPIGRIVMYALLLCWSICKSTSSPLDVSYTDEQEFSNNACLSHATATDRKFGNVRIKTVKCTSFIVNACIVVAWICSTVVQHTPGESVFIYAFVMYTTRSVALRICTVVMAMFVVYMHGLIHITQCSHAVCLVACIWLCRFPQASGTICSACLLAWWLAMLAMDGTVICTEWTSCIPPLLPCVLSVRRLNARPVIILLLISISEWF